MEFGIWKKGMECPLSTVLFIKWNTFVCGKSTWNTPKNKATHKQMPEVQIHFWKLAFFEPEFLYLIQSKQ